MSKTMNMNSGGDETPTEHTQDCLYRFVIDSYPTPDGLPFHDQDPEVWESLWNADGPEWLPSRDAVRKWLAMGGDGFSYELDDLFGEFPLRWGALTGALRPGFTEVWAQNVRRAAKDLGCTGHIECAPIGEWCVSGKERA